MKHIIDDSDKNKYEAYSKEEVLELIQEVAQSGELPEEINGLVITLKNPIDNQGYKIAFCTQAKYNELKAGGLLEVNCYYFITDDTTAEDLEDYIEQVESKADTNASNFSDLVYKTSGSFAGRIVNSGTEVRLLSIDPITETGVIFIISGTDNKIIARKVNNGAIEKEIDLFTELDNLDTRTGNLETSVEKLTPKTIYTSNVFNIQPNQNTTITTTKNVFDGDVLEIYATLRTFNQDILAPIYGKLKITTNTFHSAKISYPMYDQALDGKPIGLITISFKRINTTQIQVRFQNEGEGTMPDISSFRLRINQIDKF